MVGNTLSRMTMGSVSHVEEVKKYQVKDVHRLARLGVRLEYFMNGSFMVRHNFESFLVVEVGDVDLQLDSLKWVSLDFGVLI